MECAVCSAVQRVFALTVHLGDVSRIDEWRRHSPKLSCLHTDKQLGVIDVHVQRQVSHRQSMLPASGGVRGRHCAELDRAAAALEVVADLEAVRSVHSGATHQPERQ